MAFTAGGTCVVVFARERGYSKFRTRTAPQGGFMHLKSRNVVRNVFRKRARLENAPASGHKCISSFRPTNPFGGRCIDKDPSALLLHTTRLNKPLASLPLLSSSHAGVGISSLRAAAALLSPFSTFIFTCSMRSLDAILSSRLMHPPSLARTSQQPLISEEFITDKKMHPPTTLP